MALISVVIPCYNAGKYIEATLAALERQTFRDFNVILADDCSTDDTAQVIEKYKKESSLDILFFQNSCNSGPAVSRNNAIAKSDATYICFCDSDDWYDDDYLDSMMETARKTEADMVFCGHRVIFSNGRTSLERPLKCETGDLNKDNVLLLNVDSLWCLMIKREIATRFPLPDLRNGEDMAVIPVWMMQGRRFATVTRPLYNYLLRQDSLSNKVNIKVVDCLEASFANIQHNMKADYSLQIEYIGIRNLIYGGVLNLFKCGNNRVRAEKIVESFTRDFPRWRRNPYLKKMPLFKRIFVKAVADKKYTVVRVLVRIHTFITK